MKPTTQSIITDQICAYCGQVCAHQHVEQEGLDFCCFGCVTLHRVIDLPDGGDVPVQYQQYDLPEVFNEAVDFQTEDYYRIRLHAPAIHCSSCIDVLEDLPSIDKRVKSSRVNFEERTVEVSAETNLPLSELAYLLDRLGYPPHFDLGNTNKRKQKEAQNDLLKKLAVTGFCFGNTMLFSLPHYLGLELASDVFFANLFKTLNLALSVVVLFYGARDYLTSAVKAVSMGKSHINVPIAIGIMAIWIWSVYEVVANIGFGYFDSLAGLIFFLLVGKWFQSRVYKHVSFERSLHDLLPLTVRTKSNGSNKWKRISNLQSGDKIEVKHGEVIPVTGKLSAGHARIDYSFVTGESTPEFVALGSPVFIGGKQLQGDIEITLQVKPDVNSIWSAWKTPKSNSDQKHWTSKVSRYFTPIVLSIAFISAGIWLWIDPNKSLFVFSSVLIVACPCALALSAPFTYGSVHRYFSKNGLYLKSANTVGKIENVEHLVFDKTGTLTSVNDVKIGAILNKMNADEVNSVACLAQQSNHVIGGWLAQHLGGSEGATVSSLQNFAGKGVEGVVDDAVIRIGSSKFISTEVELPQTHTIVEINGVVKAIFTFGNVYKKDLPETLSELGTNYRLSVLTGDNDGEREQLKSLYPAFDAMRFNNRPEDKREFMNSIHEKGKSAIMIGDGLNDQSALSVSDIGLVVTENINGFYPNSDGVFMADEFSKLPKLMALGSYSSRVLWISLIFSILYNIIGITFAVAGQLNPMIAAILMPISSITVVGLVTALVTRKAKKLTLT